MLVYRQYGNAHSGVRCLPSHLKVTTADGKVFKFEGVIDEESEFSDLAKSFGDKVTIDFSKVARINSCGVRQWVNALAETRAHIQYINVPSQVIDQFSMVPEFLGSKSSVLNFDARYVCESCGAEEIRNLIVGQNIIAGLEEYTDGPRLPCSKCDSEMEMDHNADVYLEFLKYVKPILP